MVKEWFIDECSPFFSLYYVLPHCVQSFLQFWVPPDQSKIKEMQITLWTATEKLAESSFVEKAE